MVMSDKKCNMMVVGAGLAGMSAALLLSRAGHHVYLVERESYIGGAAIKFEKVFSKMECSTCLCSPVQQEVLADKNVELLTIAKTSELKGEHGNFEVKVEKSARYVDLDACIGCDACFEPCPVSIENLYEEKLSTRKAIYTPCAGSLPNVPRIDPDNCLKLNGEECTECVDACMFEAIDFSQEDEILELNVGAVLVATGGMPFDPMKNSTYGYGKIDNVYTSYEFERINSSNGPSEGKLVLKDGGEPSHVTVIHCVGREEMGYCSGVCCLSALKFVHYFEEKLPDTSVTLLYSDLCVPGKHYQNFLEDTQKMNMKLAYARNVNVTNDGIEISYRDIQGEEGKIETDMVILSSGLGPGKDTPRMAEILGVDLDKNGFFLESNEGTARTQSTRKGVHIAGCALGPKYIQDSIAQAQAAVGQILSNIERID